MWEAIWYWESVVRDPTHRLYDRTYTGCAEWGCCPPWYEIRDVLITTVCQLPRQDARRLGAQLTHLVQS
jgi:hypothetical protein